MHSEVISDVGVWLNLQKKTRPNIETRSPFLVREKMARSMTCFGI